MICSSQDSSISTRLPAARCSQYGSTCGRPDRTGTMSAMLHQRNKLIHYTWIYMVNLVHARFTNTQSYSELLLKCTTPVFGWHWSAWICKAWQWTIPIVPHRIQHVECWTSTKFTKLYSILMCKEWISSQYMMSYHVISIYQYILETNAFECSCHLVCLISSHRHCPLGMHWKSPHTLPLEIWIVQWTHRDWCEIQ